MESVGHLGASLVSPGYVDYLGQWRSVSWEMRRSLFAAMGLAGSSEAEVERALERRADEQWRRWLAPVTVLCQGGSAPISITVPESAAGREFIWRLELEGGERIEARCRPAELPLAAERMIDGERVLRCQLAVPDTVALGYHRFSLRLADGARHETAQLIVVPERCYEPAAIAADRRVWGLAVQVYSLRSARNWGIGDLTDLMQVIDIAADGGATLVGVSPLHALFPHNPESASPYNPSSRLFGNVLLLDVEAIADYAESDTAPTLAADARFRALLEELRRTELVDYAEVASIKRSAFEAAFRRFVEYELTPGSQRGREFRAFQAERGEPLHWHCLFEAIQERFHRESPAVWGWPAWPVEFRDPRSAAVRQFAAAHEDRIDFYAYLQWQFELQLAAVARRARARGLAIGLYQDLAVGIDSGGAEAWSRQRLYVPGARTGAPPDLYNMKGQNWGLPPPDPRALWEDTYRPFIDTLRANMRHAGALRIDHAMALTRLYWIPAGAAAHEGAYVNYPIEDLLGIVALESVRNRCLVIGEDLGTLPPGFSDALRARGILSYRLLYFETDASGRFKQPAEWLAPACLAVTTHDLSTLRGFWLGRDLELRSTLNLFDSAETRESLLRERTLQRRELLSALSSQHLLPPGTPTDPHAVPDFSAALAVAVHRFLARSPAKVLMVQIEDVLEQVEQANLPGTTVEHANWRRRLAAPIEDWKADQRLAALTRALQAEGRSAAQPRLEETGRREVPVPRSTYRLQLHRGFNFAQARAVVPYLARLGISHCYFSPYLKARPGSVHGYDIVDHNSFNPEIGNREDFERLAEALHQEGMSQILDLVPNHMGVMGADNAWWLDVLENGEASVFARFFDIDWQPLREDLRDKVLLPILADQYGRVLSRGELKLSFDALRGSFHLAYHEHRLPIDPKEYPWILAHGLEPLRAERGAEDPLVDRLEELTHRFNALPGRTDITEQMMATRRHDIEAHRRRLADSCATTAGMQEWIDRQIAVLNGNPEDPASFNTLHDLIKAQAYRLAYWRVAADDINYRRFFEINDLAGLRMEDDAVFSATHRLVFELLQTGRVEGLRIDHPDGLYDPRAYFERLQRRSLASAQLEDSSGTGSGTVEKRVYVVVEKIIAGYEDLAEDWPVHGTTGYRFLNVLNGLFVDSAAEAQIDRAYAIFIGGRPDFDEVLYQSKKLILEHSLASEFNVLAYRLSRISQMSRNTCDFTLNGLREALAEVAACFPVYRTYVSERGASEEDRRYINWAVGAATKRNRAADPSVFEFVRDALLASLAEGRSSAHRRQILDFAMKFQQLTGPLMAKGMEDTALYRYNRLVSLNEVGGDPRTFGISLAAFHAASQDRLRRWRHTMLASSTHDNKRAEDMRARINVLSEIPSEWRMHVARWRRANRAKRSGDAPSRNDEYLLYQTLIGSWPLDAPEGSELESYRSRITAYMIKAVREAKEHSSWLRPSADYEAALAHFVEEALAPRTTNRFLPDFVPFARRVAWFGMLNSLAQTVLKLSVPGVPDTYQGCELWDFSLVDPDNRRPVDFDQRSALLDDIAGSYAADPVSSLRSFLANPQDGRVKMFAIWRLLTLRNREPALFAEGQYVPLRVTGAKAEHVCAFARRIEGRASFIAIAPRLTCRLLGGRETLPLGDQVWDDTQVGIPFMGNDGSCIDAFTGEQHRLEGARGNVNLRLGSALRLFPCALLRVEPA